MKLKQHINENYNGSILKFSNENSYHPTQVRRFIDSDAEWNNGKPFYKRYLNKKSEKKIK